MTKEQFENLEINDYIYHCRFNNIIIKSKITEKCYNEYDDSISYIIKNDSGEQEIDFNSIVFLTEKECLQYYIENGHRKN